MFCGGWRKRSQCENYIKATVNDVLKKLEKTDYFAAWGEQISIKDITISWVKEHLQNSGQTIKDLAEKLMIPEKDIEDTLWIRKPVFLAKGSVLLLFSKMIILVLFCSVKLDAF